MKSILVHEGNIKAVNAARRFVDDKTGEYKRLFICGPDMVLLERQIKIKVNGENISS